MGKLFKTAIFILISTAGLYAQQSVNSSGGTVSGSGGSLSYSVGQVFYRTYSGSSGTVSEGVQQPYEIYVLSVAEEGLPVVLGVYPNPVHNVLKLDLGTLNPEGISYQLFDINGILLKSAFLSSAMEHIDMEALNSGIYILNIIKEGKSIKSFKISKF